MSHEDEVIEQNTEKVNCPNCSGPMVFSPEKGSLSCEYCSYEKVLEVEGTLSRHDFFQYEKDANHAWGNGVRALSCSSCGATTNISEKDVSLTCPFCGSNHITESKTDLGISPHAVIPFTITRQDAFERFEKWLKRRFFAKKAVKNAQDAERLKGIYIPYWHFNTETSSYYSCQIGHNYTVTVARQVMENGKSVTRHVQETRIRWVSESGFIQKGFLDLLANASDQFNTNKINALEPFDFKASKPYDTAYLSGFIAQRYSISLSDGFENLKPTIHNELVEAIRRKHGGDHIRSARLNTTYDQVDFQHILLPVWLSTYLYNGKTYQFGINGQTGEVQGNYPIDWIRVAIVALLVISIIAAIVYYQRTQTDTSQLMQLLNHFNV